MYQGMAYLTRPSPEDTASEYSQCSGTWTALSSKCTTPGLRPRGLSGSMPEALALGEHNPRTAPSSRGSCADAVPSSGTPSGQGSAPTPSGKQTTLTPYIHRYNHQRDEHMSAMERAALDAKFAEMLRGGRTPAGRSPSRPLKASNVVGSVRSIPIEAMGEVAGVMAGREEPQKEDANLAVNDKRLSLFRAYHEAGPTNEQLQRQRSLRTASFVAGGNPAPQSSFGAARTPPSDTAAVGPLATGGPAPYYHPNQSLLRYVPPLDPPPESLGDVDPTWLDLQTVFGSLLQEQELRNPRVCWNCRCSDHSERDCPHPRRCYTCLRAGHAPHQCTHNPVPGSINFFKGLVCDNCGEEGHSVNYCKSEGGRLYAVPGAAYMPDKTFSHPLIIHGRRTDTAPVEEQKLARAKLIAVVSPLLQLSGSTAVARNMRDVELFHTALPLARKDFLNTDQQRMVQEALNVLRPSVVGSLSLLSYNNTHNIIQASGGMAALENFMGSNEKADGRRGGEAESVLTSMSAANVITEMRLSNLNLSVMFRGTPEPFHRRPQTHSSAVHPIMAREPIGEEYTRQQQQLAKRKRGKRKQGATTMADYADGKGGEADETSEARIADTQGTDKDAAKMEEAAAGEGDSTSDDETEERHPIPETTIIQKACHEVTKNHGVLPTQEAERRGKIRDERAAAAAEKQRRQQLAIARVTRRQVRLTGFALNANRYQPQSLDKTNVERQIKQHVQDAECCADSSLLGEGFRRYNQKALSMATSRRTRNTNIGTASFRFGRTLVENAANNKYIESYAGSRAITRGGSSARAQEDQLRFFDEDGNDARHSVFVVPRSSNLIITREDLTSRILQEWGYAYSDPKAVNALEHAGGRKRSSNAELAEWLKPREPIAVITGPAPPGRDNVPASAPPSRRGSAQTTFVTQADTFASRDSSRRASAVADVAAPEQVTFNKITHTLERRPPPIREWAHELAMDLTPAQRGSLQDVLFYNPADEDPEAAAEQIEEETARQSGVKPIKSSRRTAMPILDEMRDMEAFSRATEANRQAAHRMRAIRMRGGPAGEAVPLLLSGECAKTPKPAPPAHMSVDIGPRVDPNIVLKWRLRFTHAKLAGRNEIANLLLTRDAHRSVVATTEGQLGEVAKKCTEGELQDRFGDGRWAAPSGPGEISFHGSDSSSETAPAPRSARAPSGLPHPPLSRPSSRSARGSIASARRSPNFQPAFTSLARGGGRCRLNASSTHIKGEAIRSIWTEQCRVIAQQQADGFLRDEVRTRLVEYLERLAGITSIGEQWGAAQEAIEREHNQARLRRQEAGVARRPMSAPLLSGGGDEAPPTTSITGQAMRPKTDEAAIYSRFCACAKKLRTEEGARLAAAFYESLSPLPSKRCTNDEVGASEEIFMPLGGEDDLRAIIYDCCAPLAMPRTQEGRNIVAFIVLVLKRSGLLPTDASVI